MIKSFLQTTLASNWTAFSRPEAQGSVYLRNVTTNP